MPRRILEGEVVSDKNNKTVIVKVVSKYMHKLYKKILQRSKRYAAHDENNQFKVGDKVKIMESRPISATKKWVVMDNNAQ